MTETESPVTVRMPSYVLWSLRIGCAMLGTCLGFLAKPLMHWLRDTVGDAPGPLRVAAALPIAWAVPALAGVGVLVGIWLSRQARKESLVLTIGPDSVQLSKDGERYIPRASIAAIFQDKKELVLLDADTKQIARTKASDLNTSDLRAAFGRFDYPWLGVGDPHEQEFRHWIDGHPDIDTDSNRLLRARARAVSDKHPGTAAELAEQLQTAGIVVRDRDKTQQVRLLPLAREADDAGRQ